MDGLNHRLGLERGEAADPASQPAHGQVFCRSCRLHMVAGRLKLRTQKTSHPGLLLIPIHSPDTQIIIQL